VAAYLAYTETMGLPLDNDIQRLRLITGLTVDDLKATAEKYFTGEWFVYSAGGIGEDLGPLE